MRTVPLFSSVAVCKYRAVVMLPVTLKGSGSRVIQLCRRRIASAVLASRNEHRPVAQQGRGVQGTGARHAAREGEGPGSGVIKLRSGKITAAALASRNKHRSVVQQSRGV